MSKEKQDKLGIEKAANQLSNLNEMAKEMFTDVDKTIAGTGRVKLNSLRELVPDTGLSWEQVQEKLQDDKVCARRKSWPDNDFLFYRKEHTKYVNKDTAEGMFYWPIDKTYMGKNYMKTFTVQGHYNRFRYRIKSLQVGAYPSQVDRVSEDWEIVEP